MQEYINDTMQSAKALYQLSIDLDFADYSEQLENILNDLENALYYINTLAKNPFNSEYFRTFARCIELITENTTLNENIFENE